ncbi:hypothetical protein ABL78_3947 [Leptomonas seymouri]|uniref:Uncharacterized protein n=1 Tax=Leptomonas seymouri TaxID=5684 RepID=A0A0N1HXA0_LEPSE|nr:hypothetical protein ABL78_3947 [Leptomonas seymouri]|eukprot:KPI86994.1 hypothetical protein ABL78_3947 [Leptomonas seymouri]
MPMPVPLHVPPRLDYQDGLPPYSAQRANLTHSTDLSANQDSSSGAIRGSRDAPHLFSSHRAAPSTSPALQSTPRHRTPAGGVEASSSFVLGKQSGSPNSKRRINPHVWKDGADIAAAPHASDTTTSSLSASSSSSMPPSMQFKTPRRQVRSEVAEGSVDWSRKLNGTTQDFENSLLSPARLHQTEISSSAAGVMTVPLPVLVEQQKQRIRTLVNERDSLAEDLRELRDLFRRLSDDYDQATRELEARQLRLESLQTQQSVTQEELAQAQALKDRQTQRIQQFETEWRERTEVLRTQLDALMQERDAVQSQRDASMSENSDLRLQLTKLQGELYRADVKHRESLREQAGAHAQELRAALQEKDEQLQTRAAVSRHEARLTQQQLSQLGASQTAAQEDREALRWRLAELEAVVDKKERLRSELARMVTALRTQVTEQEHQARGDAQRYAQRAQELEQTYLAQLNQEQRRCQTLQEELAAARRALQEAHRQHEVLAESHAANTRDITARYAKQEDDLREQLRSARAELVESCSIAARHEAVAHRRQRETEVLRASIASQQEERTKLEEARSAQTQQLLRAESRVEILKTRLQEKEREAELLRCTMEQTAWTSEMRNAMQHTLATVFDVPRAVAMKWLQKKDTSPSEFTTPQLEWQGDERTSQSASSALQPQAQGQREAAGASPTQTAAGGARVKVSSPPSQALTLSHQKCVSIHGATHHHETPAVEAESLRSPIRSANASAEATTTQHVETIERTIGKPATPLISVVKSSHSYAPPPLHPGATSTVMAPTAAAAAVVAAPRSALPAPPCHSPISAADASAFFRRTLSFTSAYAAASANTTVHLSPSQPRHQYNLSANEGAAHGEGAGGEAGDGLVENSLSRAPRGGERGSSRHPSKKDEEVFFDDFSTAVVRRDAAQRHMMSAPAVTATPRGPRAASAQATRPGASAFLPSPHHGTTSRRGNRKLQATPGSGNGQSGSAAATQSTPGARAAELLAQLPPYSPVAAAATTAASITSTPFSSASAMAARQRHADHVEDDEDGLQQYLKETVQQVLAGQRSDALLQRHQAQPPSSLWPALRQGVRGYSHYTQLYDGSAPRSVQGGMAGGEEEVEEDFGSVSRPRSVLSALPWQQRMALDRQVNDTAPPAAVIGGQGSHHDGGALAQMRVRTSPKTNPLAVAAASTKSGASPHVVHTPAKASTRGETAEAGDRAKQRVEAGLADTLEKLARRQQKLLQSLGNTTVEASLPHTNVPFPFVGGAAAPTYPTVGAGLTQPSSESRLHASVAGAGGTPINMPQRIDRSDTHDAQQLSDAASSDVVLDPRQLSYATASTAYAVQAPQADTQAHERRIRSGPLAAPWQLPNPALSRPDGSDGEIKGGRSQLGYRHGGAPSTASPTLLSAPSSSSVSASDAGAPLLSASSDSKVQRDAAPAARPVSVSPASGQHGEPSAPPSPGRLSAASETGSRDAAAGVTARGTVGEGIAFGADGTSTKDFATAVGGMSTAATALTSFSEVSSLSQLERRFAYPLTL